jgi:hypothetical protein
MRNSPTTAYTGSVFEMPRQQFSVVIGCAELRWLNGLL